MFILKVVQTFSLFYKKNVSKYFSRAAVVVHLVGNRGQIQSLTIFIKHLFTIGIEKYKMNEYRTLNMFPQ